MTSGTPSLFPEFDPVIADPPAPVEKISAGRRLTLRQKRDVELGRHPLTGDPLTTVEGATCGSCRYREPGGSRSYPKCKWRRNDAGPYLRITSGPATDVRAWWPGCIQWTPKPEDT